MSNQDFAQLAHLMRRAGFGATRDEIEAYAAQGYTATVDELLNPGDPEVMPDDIIRRYHVDQSELRQLDGAGANWLYRMITTKCPLEEKIALFWHGLFATGYSKLNQARALLNQIDMFRHHGLGRFDNLLVELSKDPAMLLWLDNTDNHKGAINENYGRELLELFSMGIGNYTEDDIKECSRAFTGWTLGNAEYMATRASKDSIWPYSRIAWHFQFRDWDHDEGEKTFLGETGNFNGEDIIAIIVRQPATARFVCTRLFQFFAADEVDGDGEQVIEGDDAVVLRLRLRNPRGAADAVSVGLLHGRQSPLRAGQGARGTSGWRHPAGRQLPRPDAGRAQSGLSGLLHGAGPVAAAVR